MYEYNETVSVTGGSSISLMALLTANGYLGTTMGLEMTLTNFTAADFRVRSPAGPASGANGIAIPAGDSRHFQGSPIADNFIDLTQFHIFCAATQNLDISLRAKGQP